MNRRHFLSVAVALAAAIPVASQAKREEANGVRLTVSNPPEPGFTYTAGRRYRVFCDGKLVERCSRVDTGEGIAWQMEYVRQGKGGPVAIHERELRGVIRLERIA